jgi:hypothetical protein
MKRLVLSLVALSGLGLFAAPAMAGSPCFTRARVIHHGVRWQPPARVVCAAPPVVTAPVIACKPAYHYAWRGHNRRVIRTWHRR